MTISLPAEASGVNDWRLVYQSRFFFPLCVGAVTDAAGSEQTIFIRIDADIVPEVRPNRCEDAPAAHQHLHLAVGSRR